MLAGYDFVTATILDGKATATMKSNRDAGECTRRARCCPWQEPSLSVTIQAATGTPVLSTKTAPRLASTAFAGLPATATQADVEAAIDELNADPTCTAYIVQPLLLRVWRVRGAERTIRPGRRWVTPGHLRQAVLEPAPLPCTRTE